MRQKILISAALLHDPDVLILDEPLTGLDVNTIAAVHELLTKLSQRGKIILYSSHVLDLMEKVCSRVLMIRQGRILADDSIDHLRELTDEASLEGVFARLNREERQRDVAKGILEAMGL